MKFDRIQRLLEQGSLEEALEQLREVAAGLPGFSDDISLLFSRLRSLEREVDLGLVDSNAAAARRSQIVQSVLRLTRRIGQEASPAAPQPLPALEAIHVASVPRSDTSAQAGADNAAMQTVHIFLASSSELRSDRDAFELFVRQQNDRLRTQGLCLEVTRWENFLDAMSTTRLQDEYDREVRHSDVFVCLFFTKAGKWTQEEFSVAHESFLVRGRPIIFTYFKNAEIRTGDANPGDLQSLWSFRQKLQGLGHFVTQYEGIDGLKLHFREQLDRLSSTFVDSDGPAAPKTFRRLGGDVAPAVDEPAGAIQVVITQSGHPKPITVYLDGSKTKTFRGNAWAARANPGIHELRVVADDGQPNAIEARVMVNVTSGAIQAVDVKLS